MKGGTGPSILNYVRYHTNSEVTAALRNGAAHKALQLSDDQLRQVLADIRVLAGTNPNMATGGFTGQSYVWGRRGLEIAPETGPTGIGGTPGASIPNFQPRPATLTLTNGQTLQGTLMAQTASDAQLLTADGKFHLLARVGDKYLDKPIDPKEQLADLPRQHIRQSLQRARSNQHQ